MKICLSCEGVTNTTAERCGHCGAWLLPTDTVHYPERRGEADAGNPLLGTVVDGKYRLQAVLGRGGLGTVFQAVHIGSLMQVAVKLLHPRFSARAEYRRALLPEARRAATVAHERCARLLDVGEAEDGVAYLAMELVAGETLDVVVRNGPLAPSCAVDVLTQVAEALVAIHAAGLVHCDLSPRNVMVAHKSGALHTKVLDFGIARTAAMAGSERARAGEFTGFVNPAFAAPEHLAGQAVDARADLYSFGAIAWLLLTGGLPIDDSEPRRAARAVVAGELRPWPEVAGVPRRLQRLVQDCLRLDRNTRPANAQVVLRELRAIAAARLPRFGRTSVAALAAAMMATALVSAEVPPPFLRLVAGSKLELLDRAPGASTAVQDLTSGQIATLGFHFGGFQATRLHVEVWRAGTRLVRHAVTPEIDATGGVCTLSTAQPQWRDVVQSLLVTCREGPVDLSFVVPGTAPLGAARLQLDDEPPRLQWSLAHAPEGAVVEATTLPWRAEDDTGLQAVRVDVRFDDGRALQFPLSGAAGEFALGSQLAAVMGLTGDVGRGMVRCTAIDRAGNQSVGEAVAFARCDTAAPTVLEVTGPAGEPFLPCVADRARLRIRLGAVEAGCTLFLVPADEAGAAPDRALVGVPLPGASTWQALDVPLVAFGVPPVSGPWTFRVEDALGNRSERQFVVALRDRSQRLQFTAEAGGLATIGTELVLADTGVAAELRCANTWQVARANLQLAGGTAVGSGELVRVEDAEPGFARMRFGTLPAGSHRLQLALEEVEGATGHRVDQEIAVRVLPPAIEVRVPVARSRFLPDLLQAGVLARGAAGLREGPGWRIDPELRPYLDGTLWVGAATLVPVQLPARQANDAALLPEVQPIPGHNVLAVELHDVLGRRARVSVGEGLSVPRQHEGHALDVVASFWWHDGAPEPIGEELLVEYGQPARLRLRLPLPYEMGDLAALRLGLAQSEIAATQVVAAGDGSIVTFELPFALWSVAAQLADRTREAYGAQLERRVGVYLATPVGRHDLELRLRTTRSTLRTVRLDDLARLAAPLGGICLVPVLAPEGLFVEPVPADAPPRALFRPQLPVAVRSIPDLLLQQSEFTWGAARALLEALPAARLGPAARRLVHADDPLGSRRLTTEHLLPVRPQPAPADEPICGIDFFQAYACCRLLGLVVGDDPELFRLPLGCELELAAFAAARQPACNGPAAAGQPVGMAAFRAAGQAWLRGVAPTAEQSQLAGDVVELPFGARIAGLDFGVREWVGDLPYCAGAEWLLGEWIADHAEHLAKTAAFASGAGSPPRDLTVALRTFGVVRGLALGEVDGLLAASGARLDANTLAVVPSSVPGVLRTEQLRRDGRDLLSAQPDPRLQRTGFRVAGAKALLTRLRGTR